MDRHRLLGGAAAFALLGAFVTYAPHVQAQDTNAALEARIAQLEAELNSLKAEIRSARAEKQVQNQTLSDGILRIEQRPAPVSVAEAPTSASARPAEGFRIGDHTIKLGGFIKADANISRYSDGDIPSGDLGRDFYLPSSIPVGGTSEGTATDFSARQTRFWLTSDGEVGGHKVGTRIEMDFQALPGSGDHRTTNPSSPALRRAFVTIDNWLIGQEWSNFQNLNVLPETADYLGPSEGMILSRQVQVRYTRGPLSVSVENPETTLTPFGGGARIIADDNALPDITARYAHVRPWGEVQLAGLVRQLKYENPASAIDSSTYGWGLSASAKFKLGASDDIRLMLTGGEGIGRYVGLNLANDGVLDASGEIETIGVLAGFAAYRHVWQPGWRSSFILSHQEIDNPEALTGPSVNRSASSARANLIWTPLTGVDVGAELMFGKRELQSGQSGDMNRLSLFAKYGF